MKFLARSLHSLHINLWLSRLIFSVSINSQPDNIYIFGLLNIENRVKQQDSVMYTIYNNKSPYYIQENRLKLKIVIVFLQDPVRITFLYHQ